MNGLCECQCFYMSGNLMYGQDIDAYACLQELTLIE